MNENVGFMAYNALAGGVLTGKYLDGPPTTYDNPSFASSLVTRSNPRGRHDDPSWGSHPLQVHNNQYRRITLIVDLFVIHISMSTI